MINNFFESDNLSFIASAILTGKVKVLAYPHPHPKFPSQLIYKVSPEKEARELYNKYLLDELKYSPRILAITISKLKGMPLEKEKFNE